MLSWNYTWGTMWVPTKRIGRSCLILPNSLTICKEASPQAKVLLRLSWGNNYWPPSSLATGYKGPSPSTYKFAKDWNDQVVVARAYLEKASKKMKKWADKKRRPREFQVGHLVFVKMYAHMRWDGQHRGLLRRYEGPFPSVRRWGHKPIR